MEAPALAKYLKSLFTQASSESTFFTGFEVSKNVGVLSPSTSVWPEYVKNDVTGLVVNQSSYERSEATTNSERPLKLSKLSYADTPFEHPVHKNGVSTVQSSCDTPFALEQHYNQIQDQYQFYHQHHKHPQQWQQQQLHLHLQQHQQVQPHYQPPQTQHPLALQQLEDFSSSLSTLRGKNHDSMSLKTPTFHQFEMGGSGGVVSPESCIMDVHSSASEAPLSSCESVHGGQNPDSLQMQKMLRCVDNPIIPSKTSGHSQDHIMAERKRREKLSQRFIALSSIVPGLKKMDKASVLGDAIKYVKQLQERLTIVEEQAARKRSMSVLKSSPVVGLPGDSDRTDIRDEMSNEWQQPEIEVRIIAKNVLIRLHCDKVKGVLVKVLVELENLRLSVANANIVSFSERALDLTFSAQMEEGVELTADHIVKSLQDLFKGMK